MIKSSELYCTHCETIVCLYEQGLSCACGPPWETETLYEEDYPSYWVVAQVTIELS